MNIRLDIEYDGSDFCGWQRQADRPTIQAHIEDVVAKVERRRVTVYGAGRTDSGVHAKGQVANFESRYPIPVERWSYILNTHLPPTIRIQRASLQPDYFHAQKCAVTKIYEYRVLNRGSASALDRRVLFFPLELDWDAIRRALPLLVGHRDFAAFQGANATVKTTDRTLLKFDLLDEGSGYYRFVLEGTGFLKHMVRNLVGTLLEIGEGKRAVEDIPAILASRDRRKAGKTAPAHGLCLVRVNYPEEVTPC
jgi:tRNA pseudouridine38-40 synthase